MRTRGTQESYFLQSPLRGFCQDKVFFNAKRLEKAAAIQPQEGILVEQGLHALEHPTRRTHTPKRRQKKSSVGVCYYPHRDSAFLRRNFPGSIALRSCTPGVKISKQVAKKYTESSILPDKLQKATHIPKAFGLSFCHSSMRPDHMLQCLVIGGFDLPSSWLFGRSWGS